VPSDGVRTYGWDARDQLVSVAGPVPANFTYDGVGRRRSRTIAGISTGFLYDGLNAVQELSGVSVSANIIGGLDLDEYFVRTDNSGTVNYLVDALGSPVR
jgi:hypothetical protein